PLGIELEYGVADVDTGFLQERDVRFLAAASLPEEVQTVVATAGGLPLGRRWARKVRQVEKLVRGYNHGQLDAQGIELPRIFVLRLARFVDDAPPLFGGDAAVAGSDAQARTARPDLGRPLAACARPTGGHDGPEVALRERLARLDGHVQHCAGSLLDRRLFEVARRLFVVRRHRS